MNLANSTSLQVQVAPEELVYVLHASEHAHDCPLLGLQMTGIKLMTGMADFADCQGSVACLWIDARMNWRFPGFSVFPMLQPRSNMQVFIYNCECLAPELQTLNHPQLRFIRGTFHPDWLSQSQQMHTLVG